MNQTRATTERPDSRETSGPRHPPTSRDHQDSAEGSLVAATRTRRGQWERGVAAIVTGNLVTQVPLPPLIPPPPFSVPD